MPEGEFVSTKSKQKEVDMPEHKFVSKKQGGHIRTTVTLRRGEAIALCRCWQSDTFPLCNGQHKYVDDEKGPVVILTDCSVDFQENKTETDL